VVSRLPRPIVIYLDRDDAAPLLAAGLEVLAKDDVDLIERQAALSLVCQLRAALRQGTSAATVLLHDAGPPVADAEDGLGARERAHWGAGDAAPGGGEPGPGRVPDLRVPSRRP